MTGDEGQSPSTREWVERRKEVDRAIAAAEIREAERHARQRTALEQRVRGDNPILVLVGFVVLFAVLLAGLWWFVGKVACDPMVSNLATPANCGKG